MIEVKNLSKAYQKQNNIFTILNNISFGMKKGEIVALVGSSGSGKSTLLSLLAGLDSPTSGEIIAFGQKLHQLSNDQRTEYRKNHVSIVFQQYHLFPHLTALENAAVPLEIRGQFDSQLAIELLKEVGLGDRLNNLPSEMSGGECQRVAIARALISNPDLILADEPSGSLDEVTGQSVMNLFFDSLRKRNQSALIVTHNTQVAEKADRVLTLKFGELN